MIDIVDFTEATDDLVANLREVDFGVLCSSATQVAPSREKGKQPHILSV